MGTLDDLYRPKRRGRRIENLEIEEISIVDEPANRRRFAIIKAADPGLAKLFSTFLDGIEENMRKADIPAGAIEALKSALEILNKFKNDFPDDVVAALQVLGQAASASAGARPSNGGYGKTPSDEFTSDEEAVKFEKFAALNAPSDFGDWCLTLGLGANNKCAQRLLLKRADQSDDDELDDQPIDELEGPPHSKVKGVSKAMKGQDDAGGEGDDDHEDLWPSL